MNKFPERTIIQLANYYNLSQDEAQKTYLNLWDSDGLSLKPEFDLKNLQGTERVFAKDTRITIPESRNWIIDIQECMKNINCQ